MSHSHLLTGESINPQPIETLVYLRVYLFTTSNSRNNPHSTPLEPSSSLAALAPIVLAARPHRSRRAFSASANSPGFACSKPLKTPLMWRMLNLPMPIDRIARMGRLDRHFLPGATCVETDESVGTGQARTRPELKSFEAGEMTAWLAK